MGKIRSRYSLQRNDDNLKVMTKVGVTIDNNPRLEKHVSSICLEAKRKLNALTRVDKFVSFKNGIILFKSFIESQFRYCPRV